MEDGTDIVAIETELEEIAGCEGSLFRKEFEEEVTGSGLQEDFGGRLGFKIIERTHLD